MNFNFACGELPFSTAKKVTENKRNLVLKLFETLAELTSSIDLQEFEQSELLLYILLSRYRQKRRCQCLLHIHKIF